MRAELDQMIAHLDIIPSFQEVSREQYSITEDDKWKTYTFYIMGQRFNYYSSLCPRTAAVLDRIPKLQMAFFSILAPGKHIPRHCGVTKGLLRCHLGLRVPQDRESCWMEVGGVRCVWEEGKAIVFDDRYPHEVWNNTGEARAVLLIDVDRPMKPLAAALHRILMWGLNKSAYIVNARRNAAIWEGRLRERLSHGSGTTPA